MNILPITNNVVMPQNQMAFKARGGNILLKRETLERLGYRTSLMSDDMVIDKYRTIGKRMVADSLKQPKVDSFYISSKSVTDPINDIKRLSQEDAERLGLNFKFFPIVNIKK